MKITLTIKSGRLAGKEFPLPPLGIIKVGRSDLADVAIIEDSKISRLHFSLEHDASSRCLLLDLGSSNGVTVNNQPVKKAALKHGDIIGAGKTQFLISMLQDSSALQKKEQPAKQTGRQIFSREFFQPGIDDSEPQVREAALYAAAWQAQPWLIDHCRQKSRELSADYLIEMRLLAILAEPADLELMLSLGVSEALGVERFAVLAAYAHPGVIESLILAMQSEDPHTAIAAGTAFAHITAIDIESDQRVTLMPENGEEPDEFEQEFLEEGKLPDARLARTFWDKSAGRFGQGTRWAQGINVSKTVSAATLNRLSLQSRREACLRARFRGDWKGEVVGLEKFPQIN